MSGLKINFGKSEVILVNGDNDTQILYADLFNCQAGLFPIKYLGVPVGPGRLHIKDWVPYKKKKSEKVVHMERQLLIHGWQTNTY